MGENFGPHIEKTSSNGANLGFKAELFATADKLRGHLDAAEYKPTPRGSLEGRDITFCAESTIEQAALDWLASQGYQVACDGAYPERQDYQPAR